MKMPIANISKYAIISSMKWAVIYYDEKTEAELEAWPSKLSAKYMHIIELIESFGADLGLPFTRAMGEGLFEIRVQAQTGIGRAFFCNIVDKKIMVLHSFIKKTNKTPNKEIKIARKCMQEIKK